MIKANELRLGNWVELTTQTSKVKGMVYELKQDLLLINPSQDGAHVWCQYKDIEGIPITPGVFKRCGFDLAAGIISECWFNIDINLRIVSTE